MNVRVITAPVGEPVTVAEAQAWCREDTSDAVALAASALTFGLLIPAVRQYAENMTKRVFCQQTLEQGMACFPRSSSGDIELYRPPLQSVVSVKYIDSNGVLQTVDPADYQADVDRAPGRVRPAFGKYWMASRYGDFNAVQVRYIAGYPTGGSPFDPTQVPAAIRQWMLAKISQLNEHREQIIVGNIVSPIPRSNVDGMLDPFLVDLV